MNRVYTDYIQDVLDSIKEIEEFVSDEKYEIFVKDRKTINAVIRSLEVIGEAVKNLPKDIKVRYPNIPWSKMSGMRDKIIHEYFGVDLEIVWQTIKQDLPKVRPLIEKVLKNYKSNLQLQK